MSRATASMVAGEWLSLFQKGSNASAPLAVTDEDDGAAFEVEGHSDVVVSLGHRDLN